MEAGAVAVLNQARMQSSPQPLRDEVRALIVEALMLNTPPEELADDRPLFGPGGLGLDSVDALQLVVALDKRFGLKLTDAEVARSALASVATVVSAIDRHRSGSAA